MNRRKTLSRERRAAKGIPRCVPCRQCVRELTNGIRKSAPEDANRRLLGHAHAQLPHCVSHLPAGCIEDSSAPPERMPWLFKDAIRREFPRLQSFASSARRCCFSASDGSTGEPTRPVPELHSVLRGRSAARSSRGRRPDVARFRHRPPGAARVRVREQAAVGCGDRAGKSLMASGR